MNLVYNSDILPEATFSLPPTDRAFQYGDGLFETIRYEAGKVLFWPDHYERLRHGMEALYLNVPDGFSTQRLHDLILALIQQNELNRGPVRIKLQVWRQPGGLYTPATHAANWLLTTKPGQPFSLTDKPRLGIFRDIRLSPSRLSVFKTLNALPYVMAGLYRQQHDFDDVILLDTNGHLAECIASNLFWLKGHQLYTPSLESGCINGIIRRQLLRTWPVQEGLFQPDVLESADVVFCTNVSGIQTLLGTLPEHLTATLRRLADGTQNL
ncbi:aminotransferase class IV [Fibrella forsythiae]|uniref:branched-chain-amino-acid transaminase n=1 Tax=Fibrella forsythiae TaxID=2817061 RepID=A0ABS3JDY4_9BACT|nr:aminotransferase class IV [Fibrella forsythiae]MBO0948203.1 aminotransferase class IV [Fibrella forsythiae]